MTNIVTSITLDDGGFQAAAKRVVSANAQIVDSQRRVEPATAGSAAAFERLRRSVDPLYGAQQKLESATRNADAAIRAGKATVEDKARALDLLRAKLDPTAAAMGRLGAAGNVLQSGMAGFASHLGPIGTALQTMGPAGVAAAIAFGAVAAAAVAAGAAAKAATAHFGNLADAADRAGTTGERMQTLQRYALANSSSVEELSRSMETLRANISRAADGSEEWQQKFEAAGIPMKRFGEIGGDVGLVVNELSKSGATLAQQQDLLGKSAKGLGSTMRDLNGDLDATRQLLLDTGKIAGDDVVRQFDVLADKGVERLNEAFAAWSGVLLDVARNMDAVAGSTASLTNRLPALVKLLFDANTAMMSFGERAAANLAQASTWASPEGARAAARRIAGIDPDIREGAAATLPAPMQPGGLAALQRSAAGSLSAMRSRISVTAPAMAGGGSGGGGAGGGRSAREPNLGFEFGERMQAPEDWAGIKVEEIAPSYAWQQQHSVGDAMYQELDKQWEAQRKITEETQKSTDASKAWFDQITLNTLGLDQASSSLADIFTQMTTGEKTTAQALGMIPELIQKIIMKKAFELVLTQAIAAASSSMGGTGGIGGIFGSLFGSAGGGGGYGTTGGGGMMVSGGTNSGFMLGGAAHGAVFDNGVADRLTPLRAFASGGIVSQPTLFRHGGGIGLMGEAGDEAILPLKRGPGGDLGVIASGRGGGAVLNQKVEIHNHTDAQVQQRSEQGSDGEMRLMIDIVKNAVAGDMARPGTALNRAARGAGNPIIAR